jgi:hypothetical protein
MRTINVTFQKNFGNDWREDLLAVDVQQWVEAFLRQCGSADSPLRGLQELVALGESRCVSCFELQNGQQHGAAISFFSPYFSGRWRDVGLRMCYDRA